VICIDVVRARTVWISISKLHTSVVNYTKHRITMLSKLRN